MRKRYAAAAAVAGLTLLGAGPVAAAPQNLEVVNGNNGTVKAEVVGTGCEVVVDWYGMDASALTLIDFSLHGPSGDDLLLLDVWQLDGDGAYGGDLDGSRTYDLGPAIAALGGTPEDSYQVKITSHTTYSQGADTKYKVVSVTGCEDGGSTSSSESS
jgi:hypothetical protein